MKNIEIEFKYDAKNIPLTLFQSFCKNREPISSLIVSGHDYFMDNPNEPNSFYRHRVGPVDNQLTFKRKTTNDNSFIREEHNIDLPVTVTQEKIEDLCNIHGYSYNTSIFKNCFIFTYQYYTLVYYICYDLDLVELNRFVEIEMKEDYNWTSEAEAWNELLLLEKMCKPLGITPSNRVNESLYEIYRKGKNE